MYHEVYRESEIWQKVGAMLYIYLSPPGFDALVGVISLVIFHPARFPLFLSGNIFSIPL
jgi:hypothetical protein